MRITVNTPTGNIGRQLVPKLLDGGAEVTVIARDPRKVEELAGRGVRVVAGSAADPQVVRRAVDGADAAFWLSPPDYSTSDPRAHYNRFGDAALAGLDARQPPRVVNLSSIGANLNKGTGPVAGLYDVEQKFNRQLADVTHLRPAYFMENTFFHLPTIAAQGEIYAPVPGNQAMPMVAAADIAEAAARRLLDPRWRGQQVRYLLGPEDISYEEIADVLSEELGRPVDYVEVSLEQAYTALVDQGLNAEAARSLNELNDWTRRGMPGHDAKRTEETTTPTSFRQFVRAVFKPAYERSAAQAAG